MSDVNDELLLEHRDHGPVLAARRKRGIEDVVDTGATWSMAGQVHAGHDLRCTPSTASQDWAVRALEKSAVS